MSRRSPRRLAAPAVLVGWLCGCGGEIGRPIDGDPCAEPVDCDDPACADLPACLPPPVDQDGDGLPDAWELAAGDLALLDPAASDTDGDSVADGDEDPDGDRLTNLEELALGSLTPAAGAPPRPLRADLPVELDLMAGRTLDGAVLAVAAGAFAALPHANPDGSAGVNLLVVVDETDLVAQDFDGSFEQRWSLFAAHGPRFADQAAPAIPSHRFLHAVVATRRLDLPDRTGEAVGEVDDPERAGLFLFFDVIAELAPFCAAPAAVPPQPEITLAEALANTLAHELGHLLQLGHDTEAGGGVNAYNVMAVAESCTEAQRRFHGLGNSDPALGNTEAVAAPRFSAAAAALMRFDQLLSVDTATLADVDM